MPEYILKVPTGSQACIAFKEIYAIGLLIFSVVIVMGLIFTNQTKLAEIHSAVAFVCIWAALIWLNMIEGGQASLVGLAPVDRELFRDSHKKTYSICSRSHKGDNLDRYLLGRQFMVLCVVFITNMSGSPLPGAALWGLPEVVVQIFLGSGLAMILMTAMIGQLNSQVNASHCMLDYINNHFMTFTLGVAMAIEFSGLLHASYVIQLGVAKLAGKTIESQEPPRSGAEEVFFWGRCLMSLAILGYCFAVTIEALLLGRTTMWESVPVGVSFVLFFLLLSVIGMLEGMQIAFFSVARIPKAERGNSRFAMMTCDLLFRGEGRNLPGFMIGRQLCVTLCFFFVARVTTVTSGDEGDENIFGVSDGFQKFIETGLLGAVLTTIVGSIAWQLVATAFPIAFLSNPLCYVLLRFCLLLEATGICQGAWVLARIHAGIAGFRRDEVYIGTAEERAAKKHKDVNQLSAIHLGTGHPRKLPGFPDAIPQSLLELMQSDPTCSQYVEALSQSQLKLDVEGGSETDIEEAGTNFSTGATGVEAAYLSSTGSDLGTRLSM